MTNLADLTNEELDALVAEKRCSRCGVSKPAACFSPDKRSSTGLKSQCRACQNYYNGLRDSEKRRAERAKYKERYPEKVRARRLLGNAVRAGFIPRPADRRGWEAVYDFHHPDYDRPYYGVWLMKLNHAGVDSGKMECPKCTDYTESVLRGLAETWGFTALRAKGVGDE